MTTYSVGDRVIIVSTDFPRLQFRAGVIYSILPSRLYPYHVMPDGEWQYGDTGIALSESEIQPEGGQPDGK